MSRLERKASTLCGALAIAGSAALVLSCGETSAPDEVVTITIAVTSSFDDLEFPQMRVMLSASASSSMGHEVAITAVTLDDISVAASVEVMEGEHRLCATAVSTTGMTETLCRDEQLEWPRLSGSGTRWDEWGGGVPHNLVVTIDEDTIATSPTAGSFSVPTLRALGGQMLAVFTADDAAPARVRRDARTPVHVVMLPREITIPSCSIHGGMTVPLDLEKAFRRSSATNSAYFDRANTAANSGRVVVASWNLASIPVAISDTGGQTKQFTPADSAELLVALGMMTGYFCQEFHLSSVAAARANGIVMHKDPAFTAFGAHAMALPATRGDYERASVVVRRVAPENVAALDTTRRTIMHEFLHVLGFGHTCSWPSVMTTGTLCAPGLRAQVPSPEDVAHYFIMHWARAGERSIGTIFSLANAFAADQIARGLPEPSLQPYFPRP